MKKIAVLSLITSLCVGCGVELGGKEGELNFRYLGADLESGISAGALAVGSTVEIEVRRPGSDSSLLIKEAYSESADIVDVTNVKSESFTVKALAEGTAEIGVDADDDGETVSDSVDIRSAEIATIELDSRCADEVFVTNSGAHFRYIMRDANGDRLTGYGVYPVTVEPAEAGTVNESFRQLGTLAVETGSEPGTYQLISDVDEEGSIEFEVVAPEAITSVDISSETEDTVRVVDAGESLAVAVFTMETEGRLVCGPSQGAVELTTETPDICTPGYQFLGAIHFIHVEGLAAGDCQVNLSIAGTDVEQSFSVEVR